MKNWIAALTIALGLGVATPDMAEAANFATVDFNKAMNEVEEGRKALESLDTVLAPKRAELEKRQQELEQLGAELQKQSVVLSADAKAKKEEEYRTKALELQQMNMMAQEEAARLFQQINEDLKDKLQVELAKIAKAKGYDLIIEKSFIMYEKPGMDVTDQLIKAYNSTGGK